MPLRDVLVLGVIVGVFGSFGVLPGAVSWYCRDIRTYVQSVYECLKNATHRVSPNATQKIYDCTLAMR